MSAREIFTDPERMAIARELCRDRPGARPTHPKLKPEIERAAFCALQSPTFRKLVADMCAEGHELARTFDSLRASGLGR